MTWLLPHPLLTLDSPERGGHGFPPGLSPWDFALQSVSLASRTSLWPSYHVLVPGGHPRVPGAAAKAATLQAFSDHCGNSWCVNGEGVGVLWALGPLFGCFPLYKKKTCFEEGQDAASRDTWGDAPAAADGVRI